MASSAQDRSREFWFEDGNFVLLVRRTLSHEDGVLSACFGSVTDEPDLQVDDVYFNVHRSLMIKHSGVFSDMVVVASGASNKYEPNIDGAVERPVRVPDVSWSAFTNLLRYIYGMCASPAQKCRSELSMSSQCPYYGSHGSRRTGGADSRCTPTSV